MPVRVPRHCGAFVLASALFATAGIALAQQPWPPGPGAQSPGQNYQNQVCVRLEGQLAAIDRGAGGDPARAEQIRRYEEAARRQQAELDTMTAQGRRQGCESSGFFLFGGFQSQACVDLNRQISRMRGNLDRINIDLQRLQGGTTERAAQRQGLLVALSDNGCGQQYRAAARAGEQGGFFDRLFGNNGVFSPGASGPMGGTYRTVCVRTCDGFYFPVSFETSAERFREDEATCQRMCPAAEVQLYTYHNPGEEITQAVSLNGRLYTELPTAFQYRKAMSSACSCRRPGESWSEALRANGNDGTVAPGDVVVTDQNRQPPLRGSSTAPSQTGKTAAPAASEATADTATESDPTKRKVRAVGPTFLPQH